MTDGHRRTSSRGELIFTGILWLAAGYIFAGGFGFRYPANVAPLLLGGTAFVLLSWLLARNLWQAYRAEPRSTSSADTMAAPRPAAAADDTRAEPAPADGAADAASREMAPPAFEPPGETAEAERHEPAALGWTLLTIVLLLAFGFLAGVAVALVGLLRLHGRESWLMTVLVTVIVMASLYVAFGIVLRVPFFPGLIVELLR